MPDAGAWLTGDGLLNYIGAVRTRMAAHPDSTEEDLTRWLCRTHRVCGPAALLQAMMEYCGRHASD